jgi:hypothetical protein
MSLPAAQQRLLDDIEDGLDASEPRLTGMFAIFTKLTNADGRPRREQLPSGLGLRSWRHRLHCALRARRAARRRRQIRRRELRTAQPGSAGTTVMRWLVVSQFVVFLAMIGLLVVTGAHAARTTCHAAGAWRSAAAQLRKDQCTAQVGVNAVQTK